jgi:hypothetical protein
MEVRGSGAAEMLSCPAAAAILSRDCKQFSADRESKPLAVLHSHHPHSHHTPLHSTPTRCALPCHSPTHRTFASGSRIWSKIETLRSS